MSDRTRNYVSILYPESAVPNWKEVLAEQCVKAFVSPLHDKDVNPDGTPKKPHYHVMLLFNGPKTELQANGIFSKIGAIRCQPVNDVVGYSRYLVHMDNPEKYQYEPSEVLSLSGADWYETIKTSADRYQALNDICDYINEKHIYAYNVLVDNLRTENYQWFKAACDNTVFLKEYLKSKSWSENAPDRPITTSLNL